jgi:hypothetical protein
MSGLYFRKRKRLGLFSLNVTNHGVGISTGIRGLRAGVTSHGKLFTRATIPGTGVYFRRYYRSRHAAEPSAFAAGFWFGVLLVPAALIALALFSAHSAR